MNFGWIVAGPGSTYLKDPELGSLTRNRSEAFWFHVHPVEQIKKLSRSGVGVTWTVMELTAESACRIRNGELLPDSD